jgi:hypothetical protein
VGCVYSISPANGRIRPGRPSLCTPRARLRKALEAELQAGDLLEQSKELALDAVRQLNDLYKPINEALKSLHPRAQVDQMPDEYMRNHLSTLETSGSPEIAFKHIRMGEIRTGTDFAPYALRVGRGVELTGDGDLIVRAAIDVSHIGLSGTDYYWHSDPLQAPVGSVESAAQLQLIVEQTQEHLRSAVAAFTERIASEN